MSDSNTVGAGSDEIVGVGIVFGEGEGHVVGQLVPGSGAAACGQIQVGDRLVEVEGRNVYARPVQDLAKLFAGPPGTTVEIKLVREKSQGGDAAGQEKIAEGQLIAIDDDDKTAASDEGKQGKEEEAEEEDEVVIVQVPRLSFDSDKEQFVSWFTLDDGAATAAPAEAKGKGGFFEQSAKELKGHFAPLSGKLMTGVSGLKSSVLPLGDSLKAWGTQQVKGISDAVQQTPLFENVSSKAQIVKQHTSAATSAAMQGLKALGQGDVRPDPSPKAYSMRMYTCPDAYVIFPPAEPTVEDSENEQVMVIHKGTMKVSMVSPLEAADITRGRAKMEIMGILGIATLACASYLVICTSRQYAAMLPQGQVYRAVDIDLREIGKTNKRGPVDESRRAIEERLLAEMLDTSSLFFSYDFDITHTQQRLERVAGHASGRPLWHNYAERESRFVWNHTILKSLGDALTTRMALPVVCGFLQQVTIAVPSGTAELTLIARREWKRAGYRYMSRGVDDEGNASNFVETEQVVLSDGHITSYVIVRGSIPVLWQEAEAFVSFKPKPLMRGDGSDAPLHIHMCDLQGRYGSLGALSLIEKSETSHEYKLGLAYAKAMSQLCRDIPYIAFDFHKVCGKLSFKNLPRLVEQCDQGLHDHGYFIANERRQVGVWRINCIDCLDRTNVAQSVLAFRTLMYQLSSAGCIEADHRDACVAASRSDSNMPLKWAVRLHQQFKSLWADHGDMISIQYSGSQALKGDLTRTGKRTVGGLLQDGLSSVRRAVQNNFADYHRQQVMEAFHQLPQANPDKIQGGMPPEAGGAAAGGGGGGGGPVDVDGGDARRRGGAEGSGESMTQSQGDGWGIGEGVGALGVREEKKQEPPQASKPAVVDDLIDLS